MIFQQVVAFVLQKKIVWELIKSLKELKHEVRYCKNEVERLVQVQGQGHNVKDRRKSSIPPEDDVDFIKDLPISSEEKMEEVEKKSRK